MIGENRVLNSQEKWFLAANGNIQFAVVTSDSSVVPLIAENLKNDLIGLRLRIEDNRFIHSPKETKFHQLPDNIKTAQQAADYMNEFIPLNYNEELSTIACGKNIVAVNTSHIIADGGFYMNLYKKLLDLNDKTEKNGFPKTPEIIFERELNEYFQKHNLKGIEEFDVSGFNKEISNITYCRYSDFTGSRIPDDESPCKYHNYENPASEFEFMKSKTGLSESYWTMWPLSLIALDGNKSLFNSFGCTTCLDLRGLMRNEGNQKIDQTICNNFMDISLWLGHKDVSRLTIREVGKLLRQKLNEKKKNNNDALFYAMNSTIKGFSLPADRKSVTAQVSNIGRFDLKPPLVDCWIQYNMKCSSASFATIFAFSKNKYGVNTLATRLQQPRFINDLEIKLLGESLIHGMKNIPVDVTMEQAYDELRRFQGKLRKEL